MIKQHAKPHIVPGGHMTVKPLHDTPTRLANGRCELVVGDEKIAVAEDYECAIEIAARWNTVRELTQGGAA